MLVGQVTQFKRAHFTQLIEQRLIGGLWGGADKAAAVASTPGFDDPALSQGSQRIAQGDRGDAELGGQGTFAGELFTFDQQPQVNHFNQAAGDGFRFPFLTEAYEA
nr:hypothetical protein GCM10020185_84720 [Pseudomonas brassicacearum subsp. brassicacearum]